MRGGTKVTAELTALAAAVLDDATSDHPSGVAVSDELTAWFEFIDYHDKPRMAIAVKNRAGKTIFRYISKSFYRMINMRKVPA